MSTAFAQAPHTFHPTILREYDIRGRLDNSLSAQDAFAIGCAFGTMIIRRGGKTASVGFDGRPSSPIFADALCAGLQSTGVDVEMIGLGPSPMLYFAVKSRKRDGGVMVTGSHNPPEYNGFKLMFQNESVYGAMVTEIGRLSAEADFEQGEGSRTDIDVSDDYVARILSDYSTDKGYKIAWDNGNGAAGQVLQKLVEDLPGEHALLYEDIDGTFPNHHPDPTVKENLKDLIELMKKGQHDIGIAFDGDGDRVGVIAENGEIVWSDQLMCLFLPEIISNGEEVLFDVKCSQALEEEIVRHGGTPVMWKTGHSLIKQKMLDNNCKFGGEMSGHIFFADDYYGYDYDDYYDEDSGPPECLDDCAGLVDDFEEDPEGFCSWILTLPGNVCTLDCDLDILEELVDNSLKCSVTTIPILSL